MGQFLYVVGGWTRVSSNLNTTLASGHEFSAWGVGKRVQRSRRNWQTSVLPMIQERTSCTALGGDLPNDGNPFDSTDQVDELDVSAWPGGTWITSPPDLPAPPRQANQAGFFGNGDIWSCGRH